MGHLNLLLLVDVSDFFFFSVPGRGGGGRRSRRWPGRRLLIENRGRGRGVPRRRHGRGKGAGGMSVVRGRGAKYFFSGPRVIRTDIPAQNFGQGAQNPGKTSIWARTSMSRRDFQKLRSEKLWAEFSFPS